MKTLTVDRPSWLEEDNVGWELAGVTFEVDDLMPQAQREVISRLANTIAIKAVRLQAAGAGPYEDWDCQELMAKQWGLCRPAIKGIHREGQELAPVEREAFLDSLNFLSRDMLSNEVVGANVLGVKKK